MATGPLLAFDVGGSFVKAGLVDVQRGCVVRELDPAPTPPGGTPEAVVDLLATIAGRLTATVSGDGGTVDLQISGPVKITDELILTGPMLLFANPGEAPLLEFVHGRVVIGEGGLDEASIIGNRVDLCSIVGA